MLRARMRSSPSFLVVSRRGLDVRLTLERYGSKEPSNPARRGHQEIGVGQDFRNRIRPRSFRGVFVALAAFAGSIQVLIVLGLQLYDSATAYL